MKEHHWTALAAAEMSQEEAEEWSGLEGFVQTPLAIRMLSVVCVRCDEPVENAPATCPGRPAADRPLPHRWVSLLTVEASTEEAHAWASEGGFEPTVFPRSTSLTCVLCGQVFDRAKESCPERALWVSKP